MIKIAQNQYYEILVDTARNRILLKVMGGWAQESDVPDYLEHWREALALVRPGYSMLSDIREMKEHSPVMRNLHLTAQRRILEAGLAHLAEVHRLNEPGSDHAIDLAQESKIPLNIFDNMEDAEAWLAEVEQERKS